MSMKGPHKDTKTAMDSEVESAQNDVIFQNNVIFHLQRGQKIMAVFIFTCVQTVMSDVYLPCPK